MSNKIKIGLKVSQNLGVNSHGAETHTVVEFMNFFSKDYDINLIGCEVYPDELNKYKIFNYFKYITFPRLLRKILHIPLSIVNTSIYAYKEKPDLLFIAGGVFYNGLSILIVGKVFGIKVLIRTAEDHFNYYKFCENTRSKFKHYFITNLISKFVLKNADFVLTVGVKSKEYFISNGVNKSKIFGIPGPTSKVNFASDENKIELRKELHLPFNKKIVLYAGAISGVKGTDELPKIINQIIDKSDEFVFCIIGSETNGNGIVKKIKEAGLDKVIFFPPQSQLKLRKFFNACDILVFLTKVGVGYGQIAIEATKSNLPVVAYNAGLDVEWFMKDNCFENISDISDYIINGNYILLKFPSEFDEFYIEKKHLEMLNYILKEIK